MYFRIMNSGQAEACLSKHGQVGADFGKQGQAGAGWGKFELAQCSHCFCRLCVLFTIYVSGTNCVNHSDEMNKKGKVDWSKIDGSSPKPKWLHLEKGKTGSLYHCPIQVCNHDGFKSQRGCRKHVNTRHRLFFFFDEKPDLSSTKELADDDTSSEITKQPTRVLLSFSVSSQIGELFTKWLTGSGGGCKKERTAQQIVKRCFKFLKFCCEDEEELSFEVLDFNLCSHSLLFKFIDFLQDECKLGHGGRLGYIDAISELIDFRKINCPSDRVLRNLSSPELYLKRAR